MVRIGEKIDIFFDGVTTKCRIEKMSKDGGFLSVIEEVNTLRIEKPFGMSITRPNGVERAEGIVVKVRPPVVKDAGDSLDYANKLEYLIKVTKPFKRAQKRSAVRYECYISATINELGDDTAHAAHILDISSGGAKMLTNNRFIENKVINISTELGDRPVTYFGKVLGIVEANDSVRGYKYVMRTKFVQMSKGDEDAIAKFIFSEYRKNAQRK